MTAINVSTEAFANGLATHILTECHFQNLSNEEIQQLEDAIAAYSRRYTILLAQRATEQADPANQT